MKDVVAEPKNFFKDPDANDYVDYYFPALKAISGLSMARYFGDLVDLNLRPYMPSVAAPALILSGNQDPYVSVGHTEELSAALSGSEMVLINRSGHLPMFENWSEYQTAITSFMDRLMSSKDANKALF